MERVDDRSDGVIPPDPAQRETRIFIAAGIAAALGLVLWVGGLWWSSAAEFSDGSTVSERRDVLRQAEQFTVAYNTYDSTDVEEFEARIDPLVTPAFADSELHGLFVENLRIGDATFGVPLTQEATFRSAAILEYSGDAATVLVVITPTLDQDLEAIDLDAVAASLTDAQLAEIVDKYGDDVPPRDLALLHLLEYLQTLAVTPAWSITLERHDGEWLVSEAEHLRYGFAPDSESIEDGLSEGEGE